MTEAELRAENARLQERLQTMQLQHEILNMIRDMRQDIREMARSLNVGQAERTTENLISPQKTSQPASPQVSIKR